MARKIYLCCCIAIMALLFAQGNKKLYSACDYGLKAGDDFVIQQNGSDADIYNQVILLTTKNQQISGSIMALIGGIGIIVFSKELSKELPFSHKK